MNNEDFQLVLDRQIHQTKITLEKKAGEYADDVDRLHNFKLAAALGQNTQKQALWGMLVKHLVSLSDMVVTDGQYSREMWDEKIGDSINYLILLRAIECEADPGF